jgi:hypothetical protein
MILLQILKILLILVGIAVVTYPASRWLDRLLSRLDRHHHDQ